MCPPRNDRQSARKRAVRSREAKALSPCTSQSVRFMTKIEACAARHSGRLRGEQGILRIRAGDTGGGADAEAGEEGQRIDGGRGGDQGGRERRIRDRPVDRVEFM